MKIESKSALLLFCIRQPPVIKSCVMPFLMAAQYKFDCIYINHNSTVFISQDILIFLYVIEPWLTLKNNKHTILQTILDIHNN